jgi:hypothetical protein
MGMQVKFIYELIYIILRNISLNVSRKTVSQKAFLVFPFCTVCMYLKCWQIKIHSYTVMYITEKVHGKVSKYTGTLKLIICPFTATICTTLSSNFIA